MQVVLALQLKLDGSVIRCQFAFESLVKLMSLHFNRGRLFFEFIQFWKVRAHKHSIGQYSLLVYRSCDYMQRIEWLLYGPGGVKKTERARRTELARSKFVHH